MDIISSVSSATVQADMDSSPYDTSEQDQSVFKTPETPLIIPSSNNPLSVTVKLDKNDSSLFNSQISSPHSVQSNSPLSDPFISSTSNDTDNDFNVFSNGQDFSTFSSVSDAQTTISTIESLDNKSGLEHLLTCTVSTHMIPRMASPQDSLISSPVNGSDTILSSPGGNNELESANPEYTLIDQAGRFNLNDPETNHFEGVRFNQEHDHDFQQLLDYVVTDDSHKVPKVRRDSDAPSSINKEEDVTVDKLFEADLANSTAEFSFNKFGSEVSQGIFTFGGKKLSGADTTSTNTTLIVTSAVSAPFDAPKTCEIIKNPITPVTRSHRGGRHIKEPNLCQQYPSRTEKYELRILEQPEEQHRARYLTEGSRGAIKNVSQEGNPAIKLYGDVDHATLQVFIGNDQGRVKPHAFYQACKVCGKNSTPCQEREIEGTVVIEMEMDTVNDKTCSIDNVGILKLRNADVENRVGIQKAKKKSTKARLIFRVQFQKPDGNIQILQVASRSINCTQPIGQPEICKMSLRESTVNGNMELIMIGKNFMKGTKVFFQEITGEDGPVVWEKESEIDKDYFQPTHLVCTVPPYRDTCVSSKVNIQVVVRCSGKQSEPQTFAYTPVFQIKQETPMETDEHVQKQGPLNITVAPEALRLNQQLQESLATNRGKFMLPDGAVSGITSMQVDQTSNTDEKQDKPLTLQEILSQNPTETFASNTSQNQNQRHPSFSEGTNIGPTSVGFPAANNVELANTHSGFTMCHPAKDVESSQQTAVNSSMFNSHGDTTSQANFENNAGQYGTNNQTSHVVSGEQKMQEFSQNLHGFNPSENVHNSEDFTSNIQTNHQSVINTQQSLHQFGNNPNNPQTIQGFHAELNSSQFIVDDIQSQQQSVASFQQQNNGNIQPQQQTIGNIQSQQQNIGNIQIQQHNMGNIQTQQHNIGNIQCQQPNVGNIQPQQHNMGNIQCQQQNMDIGNIQSPQQNLDIGNIQAQQQNLDIGNIQTQQQNLDMRNIQTPQQNIGNIQAQQHNLDIGNIQSQQQNIGNIQAQQQNLDIGNIQAHQQNLDIGNIQAQQNIGNVQQEEFHTSFNNSQEIGSNFQVQGFSSDINVQTHNQENGSIQSNTLNNEHVPVTAASSTNTTPEQIGYSDVAMRLLQQLLTSKPSASTTHVTNPYSNNSPSASNNLYTTTATHQQANPTGMQTSPAPLNLPSPVLPQQVVLTPSPEPKAQVPPQGILHQMLSQDLDIISPETISSPPSVVDNGKPAVQQLDSLRLQAMAQQVQQQAQQAQNAQQTTLPSNGNVSRGPQIIVLGGNSLTTGQQISQSSTTAVATSPSILILPGGGGDNNNTSSNPQSQVEFILRSILGSLKPESQ